MDEANKQQLIQNIKYLIIHLIFTLLIMDAIALASGYMVLKFIRSPMSQKFRPTQVVPLNRSDDFSSYLTGFTGDLMRSYYTVT